MQLESGETTEDMSYVDASSLTLSDMGSMNSGGMGGFGGPDNANEFDSSNFNGNKGIEPPEGSDTQFFGQNGAITGMSSV